jgi:MerR family mercuric resistance operon transcriptional regulator
LEHLTIGQLAAEAGVHKETIRYYQSIGLVPQLRKPPGSVRRYGTATVSRLRFIKRAQQLGFTLDEVARLLLLEDGQDCRATRALAEQKLEVIRARIGDLNRMRRLLERLIHECEGGKRPRACPIISALSGLHTHARSGATVATSRTS